MANGEDAFDNKEGIGRITFCSIDLKNYLIFRCLK